MQPTTKIVITVVVAVLIVLISFGTLFSGSAINSFNPSTSSTNSPKGTAILLPSPYESFVDSFNPFSSTVYPNGIQSLFYEPLFQIDPINGTTLPWLATSYSWHDNNLELNMTLRKNVEFSNGEPFNSSDVVFTFDLMKKYPALDTYSLWSVLKNVTSNGPYNVTFTFKEPDTPSFYYIAGLTLIVPKSIWQNVSNPVTYTNPNPIGTGPFILTKVTSNEIELSANPHYWQPGEPHLAHIIYYSYTSNTAADLALEEGQVDWAGLFIPDLNSLYVAKDPSHYGYYFGYETPVSLYVNNMRWPLNQSFFRLAMSLSINRTKIYKEGEYGYETPALGASIMITQAPNWLNSTNLHALENITQYNVTLAKQILSKHGYTWNSKGLLVAPNGTLVPAMTIMTPAGWTDWDADISIESQEFAQIGLRVSVVTPVYSTLYNDLETGNYWIIQYSNTQWGPNPYYGYYGEYYDGGHVTPIGRAATTDFERFNSSTDGFAHDLSAFSKTSNVNEQKQLVNNMTSILIKTIPTISVVNAAIWYEWNNKTIQGFPTSSNNYWIGAPWQVPAMEVVALHLYSTQVTVAKHVSTPGYIYYIIGAVIAIVVIAAAVVGIVVSRRKHGGLK
ncbi:oligopeptide ABC transporter Opp2, extracellular binding protein [Picrophilus oshimae DSM 9789]|uniref:Oligopeptide ABC transporter Opp2, extracellular binding protein n=2 Tax=Picrophilus oshimae TaxID=46632 RepID=Q6KZ20_PICTO|nr:oligopeptide ABC transporter Opp2, extracellular binding protein [Picrophilus oshimae DSM 9789]